MLTTIEIIDVVTAVTGITHDQMKTDGRFEYLDAKYLATVIMHEEGYAVKAIANCFNQNRSTPHGALKAADKLLATDQKFKTNYLACIARIADMEDNEMEDKAA